MPKNKDLKRAVRARMAKTGESYTAARAHLIGADEPDPARYAELADVTDDAVRTATGKNWHEWVEALDAIDATRLAHPDIAEHVRTQFGIDSWWAQSVTVGYERIRGLRQKGQRRDGSFEINKSKTFPVPVNELYAAFVNAPVRDTWLADVDVEVRTCRENRSVRWGWPDGSRVQAYFTDKGPGKSSVAIQHAMLPSKSMAERMKTEWGARLTALAGLLP